MKDDGSAGVELSAHTSVRIPSTPNPMVAKRGGPEASTADEKWSTHKDEKTGREYYVSSKTGKPTWEKPMAL